MYYNKTNQRINSSVTHYTFSSTCHIYHVGNNLYAYGGGSVFLFVVHATLACSTFFSMSVLLPSVGNFRRLFSRVNSSTTNYYTVYVLASDPKIDVRTVQHRSALFPRLVSLNLILPGRAPTPVAHHCRT